MCYYLHIIDHEELQNRLSIRYVDLTFTIQFAVDCRLLEQKASALRGGMGQMLLERNCVRNRDCGSCDFAAECIVRRTMYSKYEIRPEFVTRGDSIGRYSSTQNHRIEFYGLKGHMTIDGVPDDLLLVMLAGERLHIGKNTSFGFGRYTVKPVRT